MTEHRKRWSIAIEQYDDGSMTTISCRYPSNLLLQVFGGNIPAMLRDSSSLGDSDDGGKLGYRVEEAAQVAGLSATRLREHIRYGELKTRLNGRLFVILHEDLLDFLRALPVYDPNRRMEA